MTGQRVGRMMLMLRDLNNLLQLSQEKKRNGNGQLVMFWGSSSVDNVRRIAVSVRSQ